MDTRSAYEQLAARANLNLGQTSREEATDAVEATDTAAAEMDKEAMHYYLERGEPIGLLVDEALKVGTRALVAASSMAVYLDGPGADALASHPARFRELLERRAAELPDGGNTETYRAGRLLYLIAYQLGVAGALVRRSDAVEQAFAVDDLLEVAAMAWLLSELLAAPRS